MSRLHAPLWNKIKATASPVEVTVSRERRDTIIQAVRKLKTEENVTRKNLGLVYFGGLKCQQQQIDPATDLWLLTFELKFNPLIL
jgi:hypothetical protein